MRRVPPELVCRENDKWPEVMWVVVVAGIRIGPRFGGGEGGRRERRDKTAAAHQHKLACHQSTRHQ